VKFINNSLLQQAVSTVFMIINNIIKLNIIKRVSDELISTFYNVLIFKVVETREELKISQECF
jgi:hypothetical protein